MVISHYHLSFFSYYEDSTILDLLGLLPHLLKIITYLYVLETKNEKK